MNFFVSFIFVFWVNLQVLLVKYVWVVVGLLGCLYKSSIKVIWELVWELYIRYKRMSDNNVWFVLCEKCKIGGGVKVLWEVRWEFEWGLCEVCMRFIWHCFKVFSVMCRCSTYAKLHSPKISKNCKIPPVIYKWITQYYISSNFNIHK